jgi:Xaa-Pro aminopeptidase
LSALNKEFCKETLFYILPTTKLSDIVKTHLSEAGVQIKNYADILNDLSNMKKNPFLVDPDTTNMSILQAIGQENTITRQGPTAITMAKAIKNSSELDGIRKCHKRDAVALCKHFAWLSESLLKGDTIREFEAATHLESMRQLDSKYVGPSFDTISATGPNGAIIHYQPSETNSCIINPRRLYLCDSGAQYLDGTTDITRTFLFNGEATEFQKRAFTRVLQSHISVDQAIFPQGGTGAGKRNSGYLLDAIARLPLWKDGLNFRHGIGHGIGAYLNVHDGPHGIGNMLSYNNVPLLTGIMVTNGICVCMA